MNKPFYGCEVIPSGMTDELEIMLGIVREKSLYPDRILFQIIDDDESVLYLPEYRIHICRNSKYEPTNASNRFAEVVDLNIYSPTCHFTKRCNYVLASAHYQTEGLGEKAHTVNLRLWGDSGGAQMKLDVTDKNHPYTVIFWMNDNCDIGVSVDHAPLLNKGDYLNRTFIQAAAKVQRYNNEIFAQEAREDLHLLNVAQGGTLDLAREWIDTVKNDRFKGWAIGMQGHEDVIDSALPTALLLMEEYEEKEWLHFFGVGAGSSLFLLTWLGRYIKVTIDCTSHLRAANNLTYYKAGANGKLTQCQVKPKRNGDRKDVPDPSTPLPCDCPICRTLGTFATFEHNIPYGPLLQMHNIWVEKKLQDQWNEWARTLTRQEYRRKIQEAYPQRKYVRRFDFLNCALEIGLSYAQDIYADLFTKKAVTSYLKQGEDGEYIDIPSYEKTNFDLIPYTMPLHEMGIFSEAKRKYFMQQHKQKWPTSNVF